MDNLEWWLGALGLERLAPVLQANDIDLEILPELTEADFEALGISLGQRKKLLKAASLLQHPSSPEPTTPVPRSDLCAAQSAERRQLSVIFCDLVDSTPLSARLDPEDLGEVIRTYQACVAETIARFGGFIARYVGDGVLIYFGWPEAYEANAERAVRAALAVVAAISDLAVRGETLQVRIGIATGLGVVGEAIGTGEARQQTVIGETPNRAARLQALAGPNEIAIDTATRNQLGRMFECYDHGAVALKGLPEPVHTWIVQGESPVASRFEALRDGRLTPLIGREEELEFLLRRWRQAVQGEGKVVLLSGEPGIGKSRLLAALEERLRGEPFTRLRYFCSPYHKDSPLHPIIAQLERAAGVSRADTGLVSLGKLQALLTMTATSVEDTVLLADLLSIQTEDVLPELDLLPRQRRERTFDALVRRVEALARAQPVLMLVEDAQCADPSSCELFDLIIERLAGLPVLLLITFRPEFQPPWIGRVGVSVLNLSRLDRRETTVMAAGVAARAIPAELIERIVAQTDGVPLFIEELTRAVLEAGFSPNRDLSRLAVPETLQASLIARLDQLPAAKMVAQIGTVIGRSFSYELIAAVAQFPERVLLDGLTQLVRSGLAFQRGAPPEASYTFKHALVQQAAYDTLLRSRRIELHARVAQALAERVTGEGAQHQGLLLHHATLAGDHELAVRACIAVGERSIRIFANEEAVTLAEKGFGHLTHVQNGEQRTRYLVALLRLQVYAWRGPQTLDISGLIDQLHAAADAAVCMGLHRDAAEALAAAAWLQHKSNNYERASQTILKAEEASRLADQRTRCHQLANTARCLLEVEREVPRALVLIADAESMADSLNVDFVELEWGRSHAARWNGDLDRAHALINRAVELARLREERWREIECLIWLATIDLERDKLDSVVRHCDEIERLATVVGQPHSPVASAFRTLACLIPSDWNETSLLDQSLAALRNFDDKANLAYVLNYSASCFLREGRPEQARTAAAEALATARAMRRTTEMVVAVATLARAMFSDGDRAAATACLEELASNCDLSNLSARAGAHLEGALDHIGASVPMLKSKTSRL